MDSSYRHVEMEKQVNNFGMEIFRELTGKVLMNLRVIKNQKEMVGEGTNGEGKKVTGIRY